MNRTFSLPAVIAIAAVTIVAGFAVLMVLAKFLWAWIIPDLFPGAVSAGLVVVSISWMTAFKLAVCVSIIVGMVGVKKCRQAA